MLKIEHFYEADKGVGGFCKMGFKPFIYHDVPKLKGLIYIFSIFSKNICRMIIIRLVLENIVSTHCNARSLVDFGQFLTILESFEKKVYFHVMSL